MKSYKHILLGLGLGLIISSCFMTYPLKDEQNDKTTLPANGVGFVMDKMDEYPEQVGDYTRGDQNSGNNEMSLQQENSKVEIVIPKGVDSRHVAAVLYENGLITSQQEFDARITRLNLDKKIRYGLFSIEKGQSMDSIINIITQTDND